MDRKNNILLSICIPTYNRLFHVNKIVEELLKCDSTEFDVFVIDNCSTNGEKLRDFKDSRVHYIMRDNPVDGRINLWDSLKFADGQYRMFCIDRDTIFGNKLEYFLEQLKKSDVRGGRCIIDKKENADHVNIYEKCKYPIAYGNLHPSGNFVRWDVVLEEYSKIKYSNRESRYYLTPFMNDFILANAMIKGLFMIYDMPLVYTAMTIAEKDEPKSSTYSPQKGNLYFMPKSRMDQMNMDIDHLNTFDLNKNIYTRYLRRIIANTLTNCTLSYRDIMSNPTLCEHYYLETKSVNYSEIRSIVSMFRKNYFSNESIKINLMERYYTYEWARLRCILSSVKRKIVQILKGEH